MQSARIAELLSPFLGDVETEDSMQRRERTARDGGQLTTDDLQYISTYIDLLLRWNARINLTAVGDPEEIVTRHFGESLFAARHLFPNRMCVGTAGPGSPAEPGPAGFSLADVGSGAGFPGLPIKIWAPQIALTLIESNHKKATFLREAARELTLTNVNIQAARAEAITGKKFDVVTLRAVERFESILPIATRLVAPGGRLALLIGSAQLVQARSLLADLQWHEPIPIPLATARILAIATRASNKRGLKPVNIH